MLENGGTRQRTSLSNTARLLKSSSTLRGLPLIRSHKKVPSSVALANRDENSCE